MPVAPGGDEGRDKLRKAAGTGKYGAIRGCPNGVTRPFCGDAAFEAGPTRGTETSQYPQEKKITMIPRVAASESGGAQTRAVATRLGGSRSRRERLAAA